MNITVKNGIYKSTLGCNKKGSYYKDGKIEVFELTEDEQLQGCYKSLIDDVRHRVFVRTVADVVCRHLNISIEELDGIDIRMKKVSGEHTSIEISQSMVKINKDLEW